MKKVNINIFKFVLVILFALSFYYLGGNRGFNLDFGYFFPHIISLIFIALLLVKNKNVNIDKCIIKGFSFAFKPEVITILIGFILFLLYGYDFSYFKHGVSSTLLYLLPILEALALIYIFKDDALDLIFLGSVISYCIVIFYFIINNGLFQLFITLYNQIFNNSATFTILEAHEITFVFGLFFLYYINYPKKYFFRIIICLFFLFLGFKRILALALVISLLFKYFANMIKSDISYKRFLFIVSLSIIFICYLWIFLLRDGYLMNNYYNVNAYEDSTGISGRLGLSFQLNSQYDFSVTYVGKGFSFVDQYREENIIDNSVGLHNDLLRKYVEYGFIIYGIYLYYRLYVISKKLLYYKDRNNSIIYMMMMISTIICWATDNIAGYFVFLVCFNSFLIYLFYDKTVRGDKYVNKNTQ